MDFTATEGNDNMANVEVIELSSIQEKVLLQLPLIEIKTTALYQYCNEYKIQTLAYDPETNILKCLDPISVSEDELMKIWSSNLAHNSVSSIGRPTENTLTYVPDDQMNMESGNGQSICASGEESFGETEVMEFQETSFAFESSITDTQNKDVASGPVRALNNHNSSMDKWSALFGDIDDLDQTLSENELSNSPIIMVNPNEVMGIDLAMSPSTGQTQNQTPSREASSFPLSTDDTSNQTARQPSIPVSINFPSSSTSNVTRNRNRSYTSRKEMLTKLKICPNLHVCDICQKQFSMRASWINHLESHNGKVVFSCTLPDCTRVYKTKLELDTHVKNCHDPLNVKKLTCGTCKKSYSTPTYLRKHLKICSKSSGNKLHQSRPATKKLSSALSSGTEGSSSSKIKLPFQCSETSCDKTFDTMGGLRRHLKAHVQKSFKCPLCDRVYKRQNALLFHLSDKHGN